MTYKPGPQREHRPSVHEAENQVEEEQWKCETCQMPAQEGQKYCLSCDMYWEDVRNGGLFDEQVETPGSREHGLREQMRLGYHWE